MNNGSGERGRFWGIFIGILLLSFVPLLVQCYLVHGQFVFFDASGPHTFIAGNLTSYSGIGFDYRVIEDYTKNHKLAYTSDFQYLVKHILEDFPGFIKLYLRKLYFFFNNFEIPSNLSIYLYRETFRFIPLVWNHFGLYSALGIVGVILTLKKKKEAFLLFSYIFSLTLANLIFLSEARYRLPVVPYYIVFGAFSLDFVVRELKERKYKKVASIIVVILVLFIVFLEPKTARPIRADDLLNFAYSWMKKGSIEKSDEYLNRAQALYPLDARVYFNKGQNRFAQEDFQMAVNNYEKAIELNGKMTNATDRLVDTLFLLSKKKMDGGGCLEAIFYLKKILYHRPRSTGTLSNLGVCHALLGQDDEARTLFQKALQINPDYDPAKVNLKSLEKHNW